jgi:hypothetical protein
MSQDDRMSLTERSDCEHGYRAAGGTFDCPACMADHDAAEYWQGVASAADEQLRGAVEALDRAVKLGAWIRRDCNEPDKVLAYAQELVQIATQLRGQ